MVTSRRQAAKSPIIGRNSCSMQSELEDTYCIYCCSFGIQKSSKTARHDTQKQRDSLGLIDAKAEQTLGLGQVVQIFSGVHRPAHSATGNSMTKGFPMPLPEVPWMHYTLSKMFGDQIHHEWFKKALLRRQSLHTHKLQFDMRARRDCISLSHGSVSNWK